MTIPALHAHLDAFEHAVHEQALDTADTVLDHFNELLNTLLQKPIEPLDAPALRTILDRQQHILGSLHSLRDTAAMQIRDGQRSMRAVNAYQQAGALP